MGRAISDDTGGAGGVGAGGDYFAAFMIVPLPLFAQ